MDIIPLVGGNLIIIGEKGLALNPLLVMDIGQIEPLTNLEYPVSEILKARYLRLQARYSEAMAVLESFNAGEPHQLFADAEKLYIEWRLAKISDNLLVGIKKLRKRIHICELLSDKEQLFLLGWTFHLEGNTLSDLGQIYKSIRSHQKALEIFLQLDHDYFIKLIENNLGYSFYQMGAFSLAKSYLENLLGRSQDPLDRARTLANLALVERSMGFDQRAVRLFEKANRMQLAFDAIRETSYTFFELFRTYLKMKDEKKMVDLLREFEQKVDGNDPVAVGRLEICKALVQLQTRDPHEIVNAITQLVDLFWNIPLFSLKFQVMLYIVEEFIKDPVLFNEQKGLINEISKIINHLYFEGISESSHLKLVLLYLVQASIKLIENDFISASALVKDCSHIVEKEGFPFLTPFLDNFQKIIENLRVGEGNIHKQLKDHVGSMTELWREERLGISREEPIGIAVFSNGDLKGEINLNKNVTLFEQAKRKFAQNTSQSIDEGHTIIKSIGPYSILYVARGDKFISLQKMDHVGSLLREKINADQNLDVKTILGICRPFLLLEL